MIENNICDTLLTCLRSRSIWGSRKLQGLCAKQKANTDEPGTIQHNRTEAAKRLFLCIYFFNACIRFNKTWRICGPATEAEKKKTLHKLFFNSSSDKKNKQKPCGDLTLCSYDHTVAQQAQHEWKATAGMQEPQLKSAVFSPFFTEQGSVSEYQTWCYCVWQCQLWVVLWHLHSSGVFWASIWSDHAVRDERSSDKKKKNIFKGWLFFGGALVFCIVVSFRASIVIETATKWNFKSPFWCRWSLISLLRPRSAVSISPGRSGYDRGR